MFTILLNIRDIQFAFYQKANGPTIVGMFSRMWTVEHDPGLIAADSVDDLDELTIRRILTMCFLPGPPPDPQESYYISPPRPKPKGPVNGMV